ncbi:MAG: DUF3179 domain-containing protein [Rhodospirillum sp.]|nr:DUF3179 domain-containing protein [Rhodospirillum sp.]MCF8488121.1 DUF3179 domain-containing protein [Rhodospirillum sp.]MCF8499987.1 DUF3179 domain-containing protein [Rhodospirillum sp.]
MRLSRYSSSLILGAFLALSTPQAQAQTEDKGAEASAATSRPDVPYAWTQEFPKTDWFTLDMDPKDITDGGPTRDGIPAIDEPVFRPASQIRKGQIGDQEPVIGVTVGKETRAYPLSVLIWHEVVNDTLDGEPIAVTYSPLCNLTVVFDRRMDGRALDFGVTGRLIHSCQILYDRETESWWEQMTGEAIAGAHTRQMLRELPSRLESFGDFKERAGPNALVLIPSEPSKRQYGTNPYWGYDRSTQPMLYKGDLPEGIAPLKRVVFVGERAWSLDLLREKGEIVEGDVVITFVPGQVSMVDAPDISRSRPVGGVTVQRRKADGSLVDIHHGVVFAFVFHAFFPEGEIVTE